METELSGTTGMGFAAELGSHHGAQDDFRTQQEGQGVERSQDELLALLSRLTTQIADNDRRHTAALQDMQARIGQFTAHGGDTGGHASQDGRVDRIEAQVQRLCERFSELAPQPSPVAEVQVPADEEMHVSVCEEAVDTARDPRSETLEAVLAEVRHAGEISFEADSKPASDSFGAFGEVEEPEEEVVAAPADGKPSRPADVSWNTDGSWDEHTAEALAQVYESFRNDNEAPAQASSFSARVRRDAEAEETAIDQSWMQARFDDLSERLELATSANTQGVDDILAVLGERVEQLEGKIGAALDAEGGPEEGDDAILAAIEAHIADMLGQLDRVAAETGRIEAIEQNINTLIERVTQDREQIDEIVQHAAREASAELTESLPSALPAVDNMSSEQLESLRETLESIKSEHRSGIEETAEVLASVQASLDMLAGRIESIEFAGASHTVAVQDSPYREAATSASAYGEYADDEAAAGPYGLDPDFDGPQETFAGDEPAYEPISGAHDEQTQAAAAGASYQTEPDPSGYRTYDSAREAVAAAGDDTETRREREDLIAAARRAAQSAHEQVSRASGNPSSSSPEPVIAKKRGLLPFSLGGSRPVLILAIAALLTAGVGMLYSKLTSGGGPARQTVQQSDPKPVAGVESGQSDDASGEAETVVPREQSAVRPRKQSRTDGASDTGLTQEAAGTRLATRADGITESANQHAIPSGIMLHNTGVNTSRVALRSETGIDGMVLSPDPSSATPYALPPASAGSMTLRMAAARGEPKAQFQVADALSATDMAEALKWYRRSAGAGYAPAQYRLGALNERGNGVERDLARARTWYERAAEKGNVHAMHNLGVLVAGRDNGNPDYATAAKWFKKAAAHGIKDSQFNLAILYDNGLGVERSAIQAYKWFGIAANLGDEAAAQRIAELKAKLGPEAVQVAERMVGDWQPEKRDPESNVVASGMAQDGRSAAKVQPGQAKPREHARAAEIETVQRLLNRLGYDAGPADGDFGPQTASAVRLFQSHAGMTEDGKVTPELVKRLQDIAG